MSSSSLDRDYCVNMSKRFLIFFGLFSAGIIAGPASALDLPAGISSDMQREITQLQAEVIQSRGRLDLEPQDLKKAEVHVKQNQGPSESQGPAFKVNEIIFEGNTIFPAELLQSLAKPYEGRVLYLKDFQDLTMLITLRYQRAGYITSRAYIPPQKMYDGKLVVAIMEGKVGRISMTGNHWFSDHTYFDRMSLQQGQFFDIQQLMLSLQDINQLPDRVVKAYLEPGKEQGTSDIIIVAQEQSPLHASYEYNNRGTTLTHLSRDILHFTDNNLTGHGDMLQTSVSMADQNSLLGGMIQYVLPKPREGLTYSLSAGDNYSRLEKDLRPLKVTSISFFVSPGVTKNFIKTSNLSVDGYVGFEIKDSKTMVDQDKLSFDRSRVLDMGPRVAITDNYGKTFMAGDLRGGIPDFLGGTELHDPEASRIDSGGEFVYMTSSVDRINRLPFGSYLVLHGGGQYSPMPLTSLEQFYLGGMSSVRGYPENDSSGDSGLNFSAEIRIPPYFIPAGWHVINSKDKTWREAFSFVAFLDGGRVFDYKRQDEGSEKDRTLVGTGVGIRYYVSPDINCQAGIGFPIGDTSNDDKHTEPYVSARVGF